MILCTQAFEDQFPHNESLTVSIDRLLEDKVLLLHKDGNHGSNYPKKSDFGKNGIPFLTAKTISKTNKIDSDEIQYLSEEETRNLRSEDYELTTFFWRTMQRLDRYRSTMEDTLKL